MSRKNPDHSPRKKQEATAAGPVETAAGEPLWMWLCHPRAWSRGQAAAVAMLASLGLGLLAVLSSPDAAVLLAAKGLAVLAYLLLGFVLGHEIVRSFRCE
jgi:hypothetical protein